MLRRQTAARTAPRGSRFNSSPANKSFSDRRNLRKYFSFELWYSESKILLLQGCVEEELLGMLSSLSVPRNLNIWRLACCFIKTQNFVEYGIECRRKFIIYLREPEQGSVLHRIHRSNFSFIKIKIFLIFFPIIFVIYIFYLFIFLVMRQFLLVF